MSPASRQARFSHLLLAPILLAASSATAHATAYVQLHQFAGDEGSSPFGTLSTDGSTLFGMAGGGSHGDGVIFKMNPDGSGYQVLHNFVGGKDDGAEPNGAVNVTGDKIIGMTHQGGELGNGVIFSVGIDGMDFKVIHDFQGQPSDGAGPHGSLTACDGGLCGMTEGGGSGKGVVFKIGSGGSDFMILHAFAGGDDDGMFPDGSLVLGGDTLYGMTSKGGDTDHGIIFKVDSDGGNYAVLHEFTAAEGDGARPSDSLIIDGSTLYGMTPGGGTRGVIFRIGTDGSGYENIHEFGAIEGGDPTGSLVQAGSVLYGDTLVGGTAGSGAIFQFDTAGAGYSTLHSFAGFPTDGAESHGSLLLFQSKLFGMTSDGGSSDLGIIFSYDLAAAVCGDPVGAGLVFVRGNRPATRSVSASDALYVLRSAVGGVDCDLCVCDVNDSGTVTTADALQVLRFSVGQNVVLGCPACL